MSDLNKINRLLNEMNMSFSRGLETNSPAMTHAQYMTAKYLKKQAMKARQQAKLEEKIERIITLTSYILEEKT